MKNYFYVMGGLVCSIISLQGAPMEYRKVHEQEIKIIGVAHKTTNENGKAAHDIPAFWQDFFTKNSAALIPNRIDQDILGIYTDYEGDFTKPYNFIIGCRVSSFDSIPEGMVAKSIPASNYVVYTARGKQPDALLATWNTIWMSNMARKYTADFEVYGARYYQENPEVDVYISIP